MEIAIVWILLTIGVTFVGRKRVLGGFMAFVISAIFSPIVGIIACAFSPSLKQLEYQDIVLRLQRKQVDFLEDIATALKNSDPENQTISIEREEIDLDTPASYVTKPTLWQRIKYGL